MNMITNLLAKIGSNWIRPYVDEVALAVVASILVIYGKAINDLVKQAFKKWPFAVRVLVFMVVCAFGYGALTVLATRFLQRFLSGLGSAQLTIVIGGFYFLVGMLAQKKRQV
jgi:hypothetical protein